MMLLRACLIWACFSLCYAFAISEYSYEGATITLARINISYSGGQHTDGTQIGKYGSGAVGFASGHLILGHTASGNGPNGCDKLWTTMPPKEPWVALVSRGDCADRVKIENALALNASGILIYARDRQAHLQKIALSSFSRERSVVVFLAQEQGENLVRRIENGTKIYVTITRGQDVKFKTNINRTSVLFVSVSFIILMVISLAWLVFYYIQRFRYIHAKDRLARHLCNAAKKALSKIPVKNLKSGDNEVVADNECCAICIEPYQVSETLRILPCKHQFHKGCVDPWLLDHRTCPMCKMDILKFYGYVLSDSEESVLQLETADDTSGGDTTTETQPQATPPSPPSPPQVQNNSISQVMVVPRVEATDTDNSCESWSESPVPDTPISPVHQPQNNSVPNSSATCSVLRSVIDSAKTKVNHSTKVQNSSQISPSPVLSQTSCPSSPLPDREPVAPLEASGYSLVSINKSDLEITSVCSDDFIDLPAGESDVHSLTFVETLNPDILGITSAANRSDLVSNEVSSANLNENTSNVIPSVTIENSRAPSSRSESHQHKRSKTRSGSGSKKRLSGSRPRSASRNRRSSRVRSASQGRSSSKANSNYSPSSSPSATRNARRQSHQSNHIVNVSHV